MFDCRDATGEGELDTLLQQGCCSAPILQSTAIFLQQAISDFVICGLGRQAIAVGAAHARTKRNASTCRNLPIAKCYPVPADLCKQAPGHLQVIIIPGDCDDHWLETETLATAIDFSVFSSLTSSRQAFEFLLVANGFSRSA